MAQQTINVGTAPNDGTGTPLRTAFQYTNSNFSELYTAVGPSGNNIVVPGNATITGDLTVDTSTLKVDSANNRVIVGHTSGSSAFQVTNAGAAGLEIQPTGFSSAPLILSYNRSAPAYTQLTLDGSTIVHALSGSTAMTLNSTGLGVGVAPTHALTVRSSAAAMGMFHSTNASGPYIIFQNSTANFGDIGSELGITGGGSAGNLTLNSRSTSNLCFAVNDTVRMRIDSSGNVGIGVTPSAWGAAYKAVQQQFGASFFTSNAGSIGLSGNCYNDGTNWIYSSNNPATRYEIGPDAGNHRWFSASAGTGTISFGSAKMTLDASGNLLVGKTATDLQVVGCELKANGTVFSTLVDTTNAAASSYQLYSTGAATYRFYVGMGGTVFATNTTISGISDARLKENVQDIDVGLGAILALKPRKFDWKAGKGKDIKGDRGFIAQEFETVFPNLIDEWKDEAPEGEAPYKSVRQDLIPVLVKAIQELAARVQTLETR